MSVTDMKEKKMVFPEQPNIDKLAKQYYDAKKNNNPAQMLANRNAVWVALYQSKGISGIFCNYCMSKLSDYDRKVLCIFTRDDAVSFMIDFFIESEILDKYDYEVNKNFAAYFYGNLKYNVSNIVRKFKTAKDTKKDPVTGKQIIRPLIEIQTSVVNSEGEMDEGIWRIPDDINIEKENESNEKANELRIKLVSVIARFFETRKGKSANPTRYEYYRIFCTNSVATDIRNECSCKMYNCQELMQVLDGCYIRFMAHTDFEKPEDIISMKMKKYSDIFEDGDDRVLEFRYEGRVIIEYRFKNNFDSKRVSAAAVSQQWAQFKKDMAEMIKTE